MEELRLTKELRELTIDPEFRDLIPPLTDEEWRLLEKDFGDRDAVLLWMIKMQLGRHKLSAYQRSELSLRFEPLLQAQAKERQATSTGGNAPRPAQNSTETGRSGKTREELAKIAGVSHDTIRKVKMLAAFADEETKQRLRRGDVSIHKAYTELLRKEHDGEAKICKRSNQEISAFGFDISTSHHGISEPRMRCEVEVDAAEKAAAEVTFRTTELAATQSAPGMMCELIIRLVNNERRA